MLCDDLALRVRCLDALIAVMCDCVVALAVVAVFTLLCHVPCMMCCLPARCLGWLCVACIYPLFACDDVVHCCRGMTVAIVVPSLA